MMSTWHCEKTMQLGGWIWFGSMYIKAPYWFLQSYPNWKEMWKKKEIQHLVETHITLRSLPLHQMCGLTLDIISLRNSAVHHVYLQPAFGSICLTSWQICPMSETFVKPSTFNFKVQIRWPFSTALGLSALDALRIARTLKEQTDGGAESLGTSVVESVRWAE